MSEITENTRVVIKVGSILGICLLLLGAGAWYGDLRSERNRNREDRSDQRATDQRQDSEIAQLRLSITNIEKSLALIQKGQESAVEPLNTVTRLSQYQVELLRDIETALAKRGIDTEKHGP